MAGVEGAGRHVGEDRTHEVTAAGPGGIARGRVGKDEHDVEVGVSIFGAAAVGAAEEANLDVALAHHALLQANDETILLKHTGDDSQESETAEGDEQQYAGDA
jgi:hypothetical protein